MRRAVVLVALVGTIVAVAIPLTRYFVKQRNEAVAIDVLHQVREAQRLFHRQWGGYAVEVSTLVRNCGSAGAMLDLASLERLADAGYDITIRAAEGVRAVETQHCEGRPLAGDYYLAVTPRDARVAAQQAFAARAEGEVYLFYDGIAPSEVDIAKRLATPLSERASFRIP